jgi:hypothetical protein
MLGAKNMRNERNQLRNQLRNANLHDLQTA